MGDGHASPALQPLSAAMFDHQRRNADLGRPPELAWIPLAACCIDPGYQRGITAEGARNVRRIIADFDWRYFTPLIVARLRDRFVVIDGQHRATAALALGCESVPAMIVDADRRAQARAFRAINLVVTRVSPLYAHRAAVAAGDPDALALADVCARGGATIAPYPKAYNRIDAGETMAIGTLQRCLARYGADTLITALQCVTETTNNAPAALSARAISALCQVLDTRPLWRDAGERLLKAFDAIDIVALADSAGTISETADLLVRELRLQMADLQTSGAD